MALLCCHVDFLDFSVGVGAFVIGLSQISSFFSLLLILIYIRLFYILNTWKGDFVQIMQFLQIDLPNFRFTDLGSKSGKLFCISFLLSVSVQYTQCQWPRFSLFSRPNSFPIDKEALTYLGYSRNHLLMSWTYTQYLGQFRKEQKNSIRREIAISLN